MPDTRHALLYRSARSQHDTACKANTLEMLDRDYNTTVWTHFYTDGSSDAAVRDTTPCPTSSSSQTVNLLSKACSHPESSWKETHSAFFVTCHNSPRSLSGIPAHSGSAGNEEADRLARSGSEQEQPNGEICYGQAYALIKQQYSQKWIQPSDDQTPLPVAHISLPIRNSSTKPTAHRAVLSSVHKSQKTVLEPGSYATGETVRFQGTA